MTPLIIVMYHYVRDLANSRYPRLKALTTERFIGQLDYLQRHYQVCSTREVIAAARGEQRLPENACLLTFDDGFRDHHATVLPLLAARGLTGSFYPPARAMLEHRMLGVHKIQFILASAPDHHDLVESVLALLRPFRANHELPSDLELFARMGLASRYDPPETMFIKNALQRGLPVEARTRITDSLFARHVSMDEAGFAGELYLDVPQLRHMLSQGMEIGGHGFNHDWLNALSPEAQAADLAVRGTFWHWSMANPRWTG